MESVSDQVVRFGLAYLKNAGQDFWYWLRKEPRTLGYLFKTLFFKPWYGFEKTGENYWALICALGLARRLSPKKIDHIHAPWAGGPATTAWAASHLTHIPFSFTARAWDIYPPDGLIMEKIRDAVLVRCETDYNRKHLASIVPGEVAKMHVTYNGLPLKVEKEAPVAMAPPYRLLAAGRFVPKKGYEYLLRACKILKEDGLDFHLTLVGDGVLRKKLEKLSRQLNIDHLTTFTEFIRHDRIASYFKASDIFIMPSVVHKTGDRDGIPTVILEALAHRLPVIATEVSGIPEIIESSVTGFLIPEKNPPAIATAVKKMLHDRTAAIKMAKQGRSRVLRQFEPIKNHRKVASLYTQAIIKETSQSSVYSV